MSRKMYLSMWYNMKRQSNKLSKSKIIDSWIIILLMTIEEGKIKDGDIIDKKEIKDGETIKGIGMIKMDNQVDLRIIEITLTEIVIIEITEVGKEGI